LQISQTLPSAPDKPPGEQLCKILGEQDEDLLEDYTGGSEPTVGRTEVLDVPAVLERAIADTRDAISRVLSLSAFEAGTGSAEVGDGYTAASVQGWRW